jgi:hypothetical protein
MPLARVDKGLPSSTVRTRVLETVELSINSLHLLHQGRCVDMAEPTNLRTLEMQMFGPNLFKPGAHTG